MSKALNPQCPATPAGRRRPPITRPSAQAKPVTAESVKITFDPRVVSAGALLRIFFSVAHDPTQRDHQGPDFGTQYRSAIFYADEDQMTLAKNYIAELSRAGAFKQPIVTRIEPLKGFYGRGGVSPGLSRPASD